MEYDEFNADESNQMLLPQNYGNSQSKSPVIARVAAGPPPVGGVGGGQVIPRTFDVSIQLFFLNLLSVKKRYQYS